MAVAPTLQAQGATNAVTSGNNAPTIPTHQTDDIIIVSAVFWGPNTAGDAAQIPTPTNYTLIGSQIGQPAGTRDGWSALFWRRAPSSGTTVTVNAGASWDTGTDTCFGARAYVIRSAKKSGDPFEFQAQNGPHTAADQAFPALTVSGANRMAVQFGGSMDNAAFAMTASGWTTGTEDNDPAGTDCDFQTARKDNISSSTSADTATCSAPAQGAYAFHGVVFLPEDPIPDNGLTTAISQPQLLQRGTQWLAMVGQNLLQTTLAPVVETAVQLRNAVVRKLHDSVWRPEWVFQTLLLTTLAVAAPEVPIVNQLWDNPPPVQRSLELLTWVNPPIQVTAAPETPFSQSDWPNPAQLTVSRVSVASQSLPLYTPVVETLPFNQTDWANPQLTRSAIQTIPESSLQLLTATPPVPLPPNQYDWPLPLTPSRSNSLLTFVGRVAGPPGVAPPAPLPDGKQTEWIVPRAPDRALSLRVFASRSLTENPPFHQTEWPNPNLAIRRILPNSDPGSLVLLTAQAPLALSQIAQHDWPVPRGPRWVLPETSGNSILPLNANPTGTPPFIQRDWPGAPKGPQTTPWIVQGSNLPLFTAPPPVRPPIAQYDWPVPLAAPRALSLGTWVSVLQNESPVIPPTGDYYDIYHYYTGM